jgi:hypothetical protein
MLETEAEEIESRSATSLVEAAPDPPTSQIAFRESPTEGDKDPVGATSVIPGQKITYSNSIRGA